jgi:hypothetical protein
MRAGSCYLMVSSADTDGMTPRRKDKNNVISEWAARNIG